MSKTLKEERVNQILYISIGSVIAILILFGTIFYVLNRGSKKSDIQLGQNKNNNIPSIEQANSPIGKSISEIMDETIVGEDLSIELSQNSEEENLDNIDVANNIVSSEKENIQEHQEEQNQQIAKNNETEVGENVKNNNTVKTKNENSVANNSKNNSIVTEEIEEELPDPIFVMPVEGEIMKQYGKEKLLYSNTLKEWTTHLGIDIKANKTSIVKASSDGVVKSIKNDPRYGLTIIIEHDKGFASVYSNLLSSEFVIVGEKVKSGQTIGTVGNSATFEILDEPHLHFEITKDGENIDPEMYVK